MIVSCNPSSKVGQFIWSVQARRENRSPFISVPIFQRAWIRSAVQASDVFEVPGYLSHISMREMKR